MDEKDKSVAKDMMLEEVIVKAIQIPGVKVNRKKFLIDQFGKKNVNMELLLEKGPVEAGFTREEMQSITKRLIMTRTSQSSMASFVAGIPGGLAMAATIPADMLQFFGMALRLAQELSYLYGAQDLWSEGQVDDEKVKSQLILYCGVMFGVSGAVSGVRVLTTQISKTALKKIPQKALTKTFWYPIIKKIAKAVGVSITKKTVAKGVSKVVPIIGGVISGGINFASMMPMANRLNNALDKATFNYSDEEFEQDIEVLLNTDPDAVVEEEQEEAKKENGGFFSKFGKKKSQDEEKEEENNNKATSIDPYEELKKLKELLDMGIITQEEFNQKKKQLLNLWFLKLLLIKDDGSLLLNRTFL